VSVERKHYCVTCGRPFPSGQGIIIKIGNEVLEFHSSRCFAKFAKSLIERIPHDEIKGYVRKVREEYEELLEQKRKTRAKRII
jgi:ribosomal protein L24E